MKRVWKISTIVIILSLLLGLVAFASPLAANNSRNSSLLSQRLLVQFEPGTSWSDIARVHQQVGGKVEAIIPRIGVQVVAIPAGQQFSKSQAYRGHKEVSYVEPDYLLQAVDLPNDPYFGKQWGMTKVKAPEAWGITQGNADICIAILDSGIDMEHPDLAGKIVANINFSDSNTADANGYSHGTHVAGIAAAATNNGTGVAGVGYNSSLMNVKVLGDDGFGFCSWIARGIIWAADNGAEVINLSLGGSGACSVLGQAVDYAWSKGVVVVAAAGNNGSSSPFYPAYYSSCIAVGASDSGDNLYSWSNRGNWVDVAAPGSAYSTMPDGLYGSKSGTSMASPHVAGLAGLVFSVTADTNGDGRLNDEVRSKIESTCDNVGINVAYGRINAYRAVQGSSPPATGQISGTVTDADSGEPISGATVTDGTRSATTDSSGGYRLTDVPQGSYSVTASASGYQSASKDVTVIAGEAAIADFGLVSVNRSPILDPIGNKSVDEGKLLQFSISASDPDGDSLTYSTSNLPQGASCDLATQTFSWTPGVGQAGSYPNIHFEVSDGSLSDWENITITVNGVSLTGNISGTVTDADSGEPIGDATVTDGTRSATTDSSGHYRLTDVPQGSYTVTASASGYQSASKDVTVIAGEAAIADFGLVSVNRSPILDPIGNKSVDEGKLLQFSISASDPDGDSLTYSTSNLPQGASCDLATQTFSWTPGVGQAGSYPNIHFEVSDGSLGDWEDITITVNGMSLTGNISGTVTDADSGEPIGDATVTDGTRSATTDSNGSYTIYDVPEGTYTVTASAPGYQESSQSNVSVYAGKATTVDFFLSKELPAGNTMWVESITFTPVGWGLKIKVKVVSPEPVQKAWVRLELEGDGRLVSEPSGFTNQAGEVTFRIWRAGGGEYLATITSLTHSQYVWDKSKGVISEGYVYAGSRSKKFRRR